MSDLNQCNFIGRLGRDPEVRYLSNGDPVASFSMACGWKTKEKEGTEWINVNAFGKLAEIVGKYCSKGRQVYVSGRYTTRKYDDKSGVTKYVTSISADQIQLLGGNTSEGSGSKQTKPASESKGAGFDEMEDDIPF